MYCGLLTNGAQTDPVIYLIAPLAPQYTPLGEESRLQACNELMEFSGHPNERVDSLVTRFLSICHRAQAGGTSMAVSWEGYSHVLIRAWHVSPNHLLLLLQTFQGGMRTTGAEFMTLPITLRRMGHILENSPGNLCSDLRRSAGNASTFCGQPREDDPWHSVSAPRAQPLAPSSPGANASGVGKVVGDAWGTHAVVPEGPDSSTDTDTKSPWGDTLHDDSGQALMGQVSRRQARTQRSANMGPRWPMLADLCVRARRGDTT